MAQASLRYYLGPYVWTDLTDGLGDEPLMGWSPPAGFVSALDLRNETDASSSGTGFGDGYGLFVMPQSMTLASEYTAIGVGTPDTISMTRARQDGFEALLGYRPQGNTLALALADLLTNGSSPDWTDRVASAMPCGPIGRRLRLEYRLAGHQGYRRRFNYLADNHWDKVRDVLRRDFRRVFQWATDHQSEIDRKVLGHWIRKYRLTGNDEWKQLVPPDLLNDARPPLDPATTLNDTFNRADANPGGNSSDGWSWTEASGTGYSVLSNKCKFVSTTHLRAESDLSTDDMYAQAAIEAITAGGIAAVIARFSAAAVTGYHFRMTNTAGRVYEIDKVVAGAFTRLAYSNFAFPALPVTLKLSVDGSTLQASVGSSIIMGPFTDTAITGHVRAGIYGTANSILDNFQAADTTITAISSTGLLSPGTLANDTGAGTSAWTNPSNAGASDNSDATQDATGDTFTTNYLKATNFGAAIPTGATIIGIQVAREIQAADASVSKFSVDNEVKLVQGSSVVGDNLGGAGELGTVGKWPTTDGVWYTGGAGQLWGLTHNESSIESSGFGWAMTADVEDTVASVDHMLIEVFYQEAAAAGSALLVDDGILVNGGFPLNGVLVQ